MHKCQISTIPQIIIIKKNAQFLSKFVGTVMFQIQNTIEKLFKVFAQTDQLHESTN